LSGSKAGLAQAEAQFREAKASYERNKILFQKIISKSDWDKSIASFEVAKASKESAYFSVKVLRLL
jgi:HlyD family secretion protein